MTQIIFSTIKDRVIGLKETLATSAGLDPLNDRYLVGCIAAYNDLLLINADDLSVEDQDDN